MVRDLGVDLEGICEELLTEGISKFVEPFERLLGLIEARREGVRAARGG
jgi:transaldolase